MMKSLLTYIFLVISTLTYGQCDIGLIGGTYKYVEGKDTLEVETYISSDTLDRTIFVFDYYDKADTVFCGHEDNYDRYMIDYELNDSRSYPTKRILCFTKFDGTFLIRVKRNKDRVKWIYIDKEEVIIKHKHSLFKTHIIKYPKK